MKKLENKVVFITGGSSGIGLCCALAAANEGAKIAIADMNKEEGEKALAQIKAITKDAIFILCDVSKAENCEKAIAETVKYFGRLDAACNNAGIGGVAAATGDYPLDAWEKVIDVNLNGVFYCVKYELQQMVKQGGGVIVNMSSILGHVGFSTACAYTSAKHALIGLTQTVAWEYGTQGIRINSICPGFIETPMLKNAGLLDNKPVHDMIAGMHAMKRLGKPEEIANTFCWLISNDASFVTGASILVDGGYTAQ